MQFQYDFVGGPTPQNLGLLVCQKCLDDLAYQFQLIVLPPDPAPTFNTRPETYTVDETDWLVTQDDEIITTQTDSPITPTEPNPEDPANASNLTTRLPGTGTE